jgi:hypothetical protein
MNLNTVEDMMGVAHVSLTTYVINSFEDSSVP